MHASNFFTGLFLFKFPFASNGNFKGVDELIVELFYFINFMKLFFNFVRSNDYKRLKKI